jgi:spore germination protein GerM
MRRPTGLLLITSLLVLTAALSAVATKAAAPAPSRLSIYFLRGEQLAGVTRPGKTPADALRRLIAGPTRAELHRGFRTYVPAGTRLLNVTVTHGLATVDLSNRFVSGRDAQSRLARLSQLVGTLTELKGTTKVRILIGGRAVNGLFPGISTRTPITRGRLRD